jgi:hypothetical protein
LKGISIDDYEVVKEIERRLKREIFIKNVKVNNVLDGVILKWRDSSGYIL